MTKEQKIKSGREGLASCHKEQKIKTNEKKQKRYRFTNSKERKEQCDETLPISRRAGAGV